MRTAALFWIACGVVGVLVVAFRIEERARDALRVDERVARAGRAWAWVVATWQCVGLVALGPLTLWTAIMMDSPKDRRGDY